MTNKITSEQMLHENTHRTIENLDRQSSLVFIGFILFWLVWIWLAITWLWTYVISPIVEFVS